MILYPPVGYENASFLLAWCENETKDPNTATPLSPNSTQTLYELDMPSEPQRCHLFLQDGPDSPPVKEGASNKKEEEGSGTVSVAVANSVSTSSHTLNNSPNTWNTSTTHYMNKSDTGNRRGGGADGDIVPPHFNDVIIE